MLLMTPCHRGNCLYLLCLDLCYQAQALFLDHLSAVDSQRERKFELHVNMVT